MKQTVYVYRLYIKGIFGRNRKEKFESFRLTESPQQLHVDEVSKLAHARIVSLNVKSKAMFQVKEHTETLETIDGVTFREFIISPNHIRTIPVNF